ncbi:hypothetical protein DFP73DRAFT_556487 [Morchella snyderi]|nr:hypothetical protein DFP73DRAFT_556487 [Morchella snyderi]
MSLGEKRDRNYARYGYYLQPANGGVRMVPGHRKNVKFDLIFWDLERNDKNGVLHGVCARRFPIDTAVLLDPGPPYQSLILCLYPESTTAERWTSRSLGILCFTGRTQPLQNSRRRLSSTFVLNIMKGLEILDVASFLSPGLSSTSSLVLAGMIIMG